MAEHCRQHKAKELEKLLLTNSFLPDFILGLLLTVIFAQSAGKVLTQARAELN